MTDPVTERDGGRPAPAPAPDEAPVAAQPPEPEAEAPEAAEVAASAAAAARDGEAVEGELVEGEPVDEAEAAVAGEPFEAAEIKAAEYLALAQRTQADFDNYRKRVARDSALAADRATGRLVKELLPALDHLDLALRHAEEEAAGQAGELLNGIRLVQGELQGALARQGVEAFSPQGEPFDPTEHEAMAQQPVEGAEPGTVALVYQQGYRVNGAVLRPARVVVAA